MNRADRRASIRLPADLYEKAERLAEADDRSVSYVVRQALAEWVRRQAHKVA